MIAVRGCEKHELLKYLALGQAPQKQIMQQLPITHKLPHQ